MAQAKGKKGKKRHQPKAPEAAVAEEETLEEEEEEEEEFQQEPDPTNGGNSNGDDVADNNGESPSGDVNDDAGDEIPDEGSEQTSEEVQGDEAGGESTAGNVVAGTRFFSDGFSRKLLRHDSIRLEKLIGHFVVEEVFPDMKFTFGDDDVEHNLLLLAVDTGYVKLGDERIRESTFADEFKNEISKTIATLRSYVHNQARKKFIRELHRDAGKKENEVKTLPVPSLTDLLLDGYRDYFDKNGRIRTSRKANYDAFVWFVTNILSCVNYELTNRKMKEVTDQGHANFITKVYTVYDEALALLILLNYESRWRAQVEFPTKDTKKLCEDPKYATKYTSSKNGYCKLPWSQDGIVKYNEFVKEIMEKRAVPRTGEHLEQYVQAQLEGEKKVKKKRKRLIEESRTMPVVGSAIASKLRVLKDKKNNSGDGNGAIRNVDV